MSGVTAPAAPRLFLIDGYALIYRAFFALMTRPLSTSRGENTSAAWGIANFLKRLLTTHKPELLGWVHDSGLVEPGFHVGSLGIVHVNIAW